MTRQQELNVLSTFRQLYDSFPDGNVEHPDSPDFIITNHQNKRIGIELTQMIHSERAKQVSVEEMNFTDLVISKLIQLLPFHFSFKVDLLPNIGVSKSKREAIAIQVANFCVAEFSNLLDSQHGDVENMEFDLATAIPFVRDRFLAMGFRNLPNGIKSIRIFRYDAHGSSFNSHSEGAAIPYFSTERLCSILKDKEDRLQLYKECDEQWFIIWQGDGITGYFQDIQFETPITSKFDKVFTVRNVQQDLVILKP